MEHTTALERLCRVCGRSIVTKSVKAKYSCSEYEESLKSVYGIDVRKDSPTIHPQYFCHACKNVLHRSKAQGYTHQTIPFNEWSEHVPGGSCCVCRHYSMIQKGGRPKKMKCTPGRPATTSPAHWSSRTASFNLPRCHTTHLSGSPNSWFKTAPVPHLLWCTPTPNWTDGMPLPSVYEVLPESWHQLPLLLWSSSEGLHHCSASFILDPLSAWRSLCSLWAV